MHIQTNSILLVSEIPTDMIGFENPYTFFYAPNRNKEAEMLMQIENLGFIDLTDHSTHCESQYAYLTNEFEKLVKRIQILRKRYDLLIIIAQCFDFEDLRFAIENSPQLSGVEIYAFPLEQWEKVDNEDEEMEDVAPDPYDFSPIVPADIYMANKVDPIDDPYSCTISHMIDGIINEKHPVYNQKAQAN